MNLVVLAGYLGTDPKPNDSGDVVKFRLSTKEYSGKTEWHSVVCFQKTGELVTQYLKKGSYAIVTGRISSSSWDGADGQTKYKTEVIANRVEFGPKTETVNPADYKPDFDGDDIPF